MAALGPLDRRKLRTRCVACARRKIKCEGGVPCLYCVRKKQECVPQAAAPKSAAVFVNSSVLSSGRQDTPAIQTISAIRSHACEPTICSNVPLDKSSIFIKHFFKTFLATNDFGGTLDLDTIIGQFQKSPSLYHASIAVGALDLSKKGLLRSAVEVRDTKVGALTAYRTSVLDFQRDIESRAIQQNDASLWTTFFLGLFELMYDETGDGFVKHFIYGTSRILQLRGPEAHLTGPGRSFFLTARVFEICRSLIYSEPTFLVLDGWKSLMEKIYEDSKESWHPKEILFDLMIESSALSHRVWDILKPDSEHPAATLNAKLNELAIQGFTTREGLNNWNTNFKVWTRETGTSNTCPQSLLATSYFHAISIYLSGIFDYRPQFNAIANPTLSQSIIQHHVDSILSSTKAALKTTNLGGVLFFFPLRVAGSRVTSKDEEGRILEMLNEISKRSFVVADAFVIDLMDLWQCKGRYSTKKV